MDMHDISRLAAEWSATYERVGDWDPDAARAAARGHADVLAAAEFTILMLRQHDTYRTRMGQTACRCGLPALTCLVNGALRQARVLPPLPSWTPA